jgi:hypothetical protein
MDEKTISWIVRGEPATDWKQAPARPVINIEPQYEAHMNFAAKRLATPLDVRQAVWWSLLVSPTAGVSYGAHGVWSWETQPAIPMNHYGTGVAQPWYDAVHLPGSTHMKHMREFFAKLEWWKLRPAPELVANQPAEVARFIAASRGDGIVVVYTPVAQKVDLSVQGEAQWFDPTSGEFRKAESFTPPEKNAAGDGDWVLLLRIKGAPGR